MQTQRINISLPKDLARELRKSIPERARSKYIAEALKEKLFKKRNLKREFIKSLKANRKYYDQVYEDWKQIEVEGWPD